MRKSEFEKRNRSQCGYGSEENPEISKADQDFAPALGKL
jgi:hypothetical protein